MKTTSLRRFAASPLEGGTTPEARQSRFLGVCWSLFAPLLLVFLSASALAQPSVSTSPSASGFRTRFNEAYEARVTRVSDGDTLWVKPLAGGTYRKLRLDGVDAPEICQDDGVAAREALAARLLDQTVTVTERRRDDYGRALVRLRHRNEDVAGWLVREGWAWSYRWRHSDGPFAIEEVLARKDRKGVFASVDAENPRDFRKRHGPCPMPSRSGAKDQPAR
ncbi:thermonuclease family protein [Hydrogenophaga pseudoflava]|uniref:thermonuclease family protein n=1 Tax=Hydrogenophaga pseudoflava TaxID=47421 RepID=UPI0027E3EC35|nr:thermonuclease family protein [Hydrogenophaga pseudoflava]MDQ7744838.1 thermonuclease family protein [Hydrogenophaga pseudoflava]